MKEKILKIIFVISLMGASQGAFSQLLLEPYAGYGFSLSGEVKGTSEDISYDGAYSGARLGVEFRPIMAGIFYDLMWIDIKATQSGVSQTFPTDQSNFGAFFGFNFNKGLRIWGEYIFEVKNSYTMDGETYDKGTAWGVAIGYFLNRKIALNLQYRNITLNKNQTTTLSNDIVSSEVLLTLSFPIYPLN